MSTELPPPAASRPEPLARRAPGPAGGTGMFGVGYAEGPSQGHLRLGFGLDFFVAGSVFLDGDDSNRVGGTLSLSGAVLDNLEAWLNLRAQSTGSSLTNPELLQAQGDLGLGVKGHFAVSDVFSLGADAELSFLTGVGESVFDAVALRLRGLVTADLSRGESGIPLRLHANLGAIFDGTDALLDEPLTEAERFALGISEFHRLSFGFALEVPVRYVTPFLAYTFEVPLGYLATPGVVLTAVERSDNALRAAQTSAGAAIPLARPAIQRAMPQRITPGIRITALPDVTFDLGVEIGLTPDPAAGVPTVPPYNVVFMASYDFDPFHAPEAAGPPVVIPVAIPELRAPPPTTGKVTGLIVDAKGAPVAGAVIGFDRGRPVATGADGRFESLELEPGPVKLTVERHGFVSGAVEANVEVGASAEVSLALAPKPTKGRVLGRLVSPTGAPVAGGIVEVRGPRPASVKSDDAGAFVLELDPGEVVLVAGRPDTLRAGRSVEITVDAELKVELGLRPRPEAAIATRKGGAIELTKRLPFAERTAVLAPEASEVLDAIADVWWSSPELKKLTIEAHLDSTGEESENLKLTTEQAQAVRAGLVERGIPAAVLEAQGLGSSRPVAPNLTRRGREKNQRVELKVE